MNKIYPILISASILSSCILHKPITKQVYDDPRIYVGFVSDKSCKDNPVGQFPADKKIIVLEVYINDEKYYFTHENPVLYEQVDKGSLVDVLGMEVYNTKTKGKKILERKLTDIAIFGAIKHKDDPNDSVYYNKYYKLF